MFYLIGLGLNFDGISKYGLEIVKRCKKIYLENYTVNFPYNKKQLEEVIGKRIISADREFVENLEIIDEAQKKNVALLVYGSPLTATTHISLIQEAKRCKVKYKVIYSASILDAIAETGLQIYKFGKIASMPKWNKKKNFTPNSFMNLVKENQSINAHSLILIDIGLDFQDALNQLKISARANKIDLDKILVCQALGTRYGKILYKNIYELEDYLDIKSPYCIIVPDKLHFIEKEFLKEFE